MLMRFILPILVLIALGSCAPKGKGNTVPGDDKIMGGVITTIEEFPHQLALLKNNYQICGASIIHVNWALTAAHCVSGATAASLSLRAGATSLSDATKGSKHQVSKIIIHASYNARKNDFDYALLQVSTAFVPSASVAIIGLPDQGTRVAADTMAIVSGWGTTSSGGPSSDKLQQVSIPVIENADCNTKYGGTVRRPAITKQMLCAGIVGKDSCQGDSGGPLIADLPNVGKKLIGVVSWGIGCGEAKYPGVYANVSSVRSWIKDNSGV